MSPEFSFLEVARWGAAEILKVAPFRIDINLLYHIRTVINYLQMCPECKVLFVAHGHTILWDPCGCGTAQINKCNVQEHVDVFDERRPL